MYNNNCLPQRFELPSQEQIYKTKQRKSNQESNCGFKEGKTYHRSMFFFLSKISY